MNVPRLEAASLRSSWSRSSRCWGLESSPGSGGRGSFSRSTVFTAQMFWGQFHSDTTQIWATTVCTQTVSKHVWWEESYGDNTTRFGQPSFYQIKSSATLPCKNRNPLFLYVLLRVSHIWAVQGVYNRRWFLYLPF